MGHEFVGVPISDDEASPGVESLDFVVGWSGTDRCGRCLDHAC